MTNTGSAAPSISYVHAGRASRSGSVRLRAGEAIVLTGPRAGSVLLPEVARVVTIDYRKR